MEFSPKSFFLIFIFVIFFLIKPISYQELATYKRNQEKIYQNYLDSREYYQLISDKNTINLIIYNGYRSRKHTKPWLKRDHETKKKTFQYLFASKTS